MIKSLFSEQAHATDSQRLDVAAFLSSFVLGLVVYFLCRTTGVRQLWTTVLMVAVMLAYAAIVSSVPRLRVRLDQAGDNVYYLGLLFTLTSMAVALSDFGSGPIEAGGAGARQIIGNFGIALATTITGIFLRIILHQMRIDPADVEAMTRMELAESAKHVKASLDSVSMEMGQLIEGLRQRTNDQLTRLVDETSRALGSLSDGVASSARRVAEVSGEAQVEVIGKVSDATRGLAVVMVETEAAVGRLRQVEPPPLKLATRLERVSAVLETVSEGLVRVEASLKDVTQASAATGEALAKASTMISQTQGETAKRQQETAAQIGEAVASVREALAKVGDTLEEDRKRLQTMEDHVKTSADAARESQEAAQRVVDALVRGTRDLTSLVKGNA